MWRSSSARGVPEFPPGGNTSYSNYGFMLLGRIVEAVSGQSYDAYIAQHILAPARMTATGNLPETIKLPKRATGYMGDTGKLKPADDTQPYRGTPAGGGYPPWATSAVRRRPDGRQALAGRGEPEAPDHR